MQATADQTTVSSASGQSLTEVLTSILARPIALADRQRAALHLLDWLGCALAGTRTSIGGAMQIVNHGHPFASAGSGHESGIASMGGLGSLLEMDDVHRAALLHPGPGIAPVVLGLSGGDPLGALLQGYEAMIRLGAHVGLGHYAFFHNTGTCGSLGAAVAAAAMLGLGPAQSVAAMGHAMSMTGGLWQCRNEPVDTKHLHVAEAARRGLIAARYAQAGLAGPRYVLEGPQGFFAAIARDGDPAGVIANPDADWQIHEVSFKPWPACRHTHPAIDAARHLRDVLGGRTVTEVHVATYADAVLFCDKPLPQTAAEARFSLQHAVAVALQDGAPAIDAFDPAQHARYGALRARIRVSTDANLTARYPAHFGATVTATTENGPVTAQIADAWGDSENPMDSAAIIAKFHRLSQWAGVPDTLARALATATLALPEGGSAAALHQVMHQIAAHQTGAPDMSLPTYFDAMDYPALIAEYGRPEDFLPRFGRMPRDELRLIQNRRFLTVMAFAWKIPFYQRLWGAKGITPGDIRSLDDITLLPTYSKGDLMASVEAHPPLGDFHGLDTYPADQRPPLIFQTTSGTTGRPQPLLFGPKSREIQNLLLARFYALMGITRDDVIHSVYGHGMVNGGHYVREAVTHWTGAQFLSAGTGVETRSANQVGLIRDFNATVLVGFGDYIKYLSDIARSNGIEPGRDAKIRIIAGHIGAESHEAMSAAWGGAEVYDWYGVGDTGAIAGEGPDHAGMYVQEDAQFIEILDIETGTPVPDGTSGDMVCTCLFKDDVFPIIRFNTHDVSAFRTDESTLGLTLRRIAGFQGRSDNMVKLRGINIYPTGIGAILTENHPELLSEYVCEVTRSEGREAMTVHIETRENTSADCGPYESLLRARLGVEITVRLAAPGALAPLTQIEVRQKPIRLIDNRKAEG